MYFFKKAWPFAVAAIIVGVGAFVFGRVNKPPSQITIYKQVTPTPKAQENAIETSEEVVENQISDPVRAQTPLHVAADMDGTDREAATSAAEENHGETTGETTVPHITKDVVPPELSREAMERRREEAMKEKQILEIVEELRTYADRDVSPEESIRVIELQEELLRIQQERGLLHQEGGNTFETLDYLKFSAAHVTEDGRFPTAQGTRLLEKLSNLGPDTPEKQTVLEHLTQVLNTAIENGDEYFQVDPNQQ